MQEIGWFHLGPISLHSGGRKRKEHNKRNTYWQHFFVHHFFATLVFASNPKFILHFHPNLCWPFWQLYYCTNLRKQMSCLYSFLTMVLFAHVYTKAAFNGANHFYMQLLVTSYDQGGKKYTTPIQKKNDLRVKNDGFFHGLMGFSCYC